MSTERTELLHRVRMAVSVGFVAPRCPSCAVTLATAPVCASCGGSEIDLDEARLLGSVLLQLGDQFYELRAATLGFPEVFFVELQCRVEAHADTMLFAALAAFTTLHAVHVGVAT